MTSQRKPEDRLPRRLAQGLTWEDTPLGFAFRTAARTITETDLIAFVGQLGFTEPLFMDERHAREAGYQGRLVPGALTWCIAEGLVLQTNALHGTGLAFLHMDLDIKRPVYVGDTLDVVVTITESRKSSRPGRGLVRSDNQIFNQAGEEVAVYRPVRLIRGRDFEAVPGAASRESELG